jgi:anti-anti-sigma regulatory factor/anti-sigma regulatory factor (Ser/Thr protein kinase)
MAGLSTAVDHDLDRALTVVAFAGELSPAATPTVRAELLKRVAEYPLAIVVDLDGVRVTSQVALTVFRAVQHRRRQGPAVPLVLCAAPATATGLAVRRTLGDMIPVYPSRDRAVAAALDELAAIRRVDAHLAADPRSAGIARRLVADACDRWEMADLKEVAILVVSELVSNAVRYAGTDFDLVATLRGPYLHLAVRDGNPEPPLMPTRSGSDWPPLTTRGRGLQLVDSSATAWGTTVADDGKIVWATLSTGVDRG